MKKHFIIVWFWLLTAVSAGAHPLDLGFVQMTTNQNGFKTSIDLNPQTARSLLNSQEPTTAKDFQTLFDQTLGRSQLEVGNTSCSWLFVSGEWLEQTARLNGVADCPTTTGSVHWAFTFINNPKLPSTFQVLVKLTETNGEDHVYMVDRQKIDTAFSIITPEPSFTRFIQMGIEHIGAAPSEWKGPNGFHLPDGIDHILFLVALILGGGTFLQLLGTATGFTVGHSVTLALASTGLVHLPSRLVESAIAGSIAFVAAESIFVKESKHRWKLAALFGLVHGFGFASAITELHLSHAALLKALFGFNLGVEIGQGILLAVIAPLLALASTNRQIKHYAIPAAAVMLFCIGSYWCVTRALG